MENNLDNLENQLETAQRELNDLRMEEMVSDARLMHDTLAMAYLVGVLWAYMEDEQKAKASKMVRRIRDERMEENAKKEI